MAENSLTSDSSAGIITISVSAGKTNKSAWMSLLDP